VRNSRIGVTLSIVKAKMK